MKIRYTITALVGFAVGVLMTILFVRSKTEDSFTNTLKTRAEINQMSERTKVLSMSQVLTNDRFYNGKVVTVAGTLFTHEEGPCLVGSWKNPTTNSLRLKVSEKSRLVTPEQLTDVSWFGTGEDGAARGYAATVQGTFRIESVRRFGVDVEEPVLEVLSARIGPIADKR